MDKNDFIIVNRDEFDRIGIVLRELEEFGYGYSSSDVCKIIRKHYAGVACLSLVYYDKHPDALKEFVDGYF